MAAVNLNKWVYIAWADTTVIGVEEIFTHSIELPTDSVEIFKSPVLCLNDAFWVCYLSAPGAGCDLCAQGGWFCRD